MSGGNQVWSAPAPANYTVWAVTGAVLLVLFSAVVGFVFLRMYRYRGKYKEMAAEVTQHEKQVEMLQLDTAALQDQTQMNYNPLAAKKRKAAQPSSEADELRHLLLKERQRQAQLSKGLAQLRDFKRKAEKQRHRQQARHQRLAARESSDRVEFEQTGASREGGSASAASGSSAQQ